jgi:4-carboxymuconolactone decarboxylase|tara:strand:- start:1974 stop:2369 length:396 start_codon:yes stop_codon:yes gene_type:complete
MEKDDTNETTHTRGTVNRRAVLGDAHVDRAVEGTSGFDADFQDFITRYAWGEVWDRPGLDRRTRSLLTLVLLLSQGHDEEFEMHIRAAITNGVKVEEIKETLLHAAVYCGVPVANRGYKLAKRVLKKLGVI